MPTASQFRNVDFLPHNATRAYPLAMDALRFDLSGDFELPDDFIVGLRLPVHWGLNQQTGKFYVRRLAIFSNGCQITLGYSGAEEIDVATALIPRASHSFGRYYYLNGLGDFADSRGMIQIGTFDSLDLLPSGQFEFDLGGTRLEPDAIRPYLRGVMSLQAQNGSDLSALAYGRVKLVAGRNMRLSVVLEEDEDPRIVFDAIEGAGLTEDCICDDDKPPIKTIQLVGPDGSGNITLLGDDCFDVQAGENALIIKDKCSRPCCGCPELETLTSTLESFGDRARTLENFLVELEGSVQSMNLVVLGSRLGDRGCVPAAS